MFAGGSQQLRIFRRARRDGASIETAAEVAGIGLGEARLTAADDDKNPPPPEAFELLATPFTTPAAEEADVARGRKAREPEATAEEIKHKDFDLAAKLYREDIKPANSGAAERNQEASTAYKAIKKQAHIQPDAARKAFNLMDRTEDAKRDDWFRSFTGLVNKLAGRTMLTFHSNDLVDMSSEEAPDRYARPKPVLATMGPPSDGTETDLADAAEAGDPKDDSDGDDGSFEASEGELSKQAGRGAGRKGPALVIGHLATPLH